MERLFAIESTTRRLFVWFIRRFVFDGINAFSCFLQLLCISFGDCQFRSSIHFRNENVLTKASKTIQDRVELWMCFVRKRQLKFDLQKLGWRFSTIESVSTQDNNFLHNPMNISWCKALKSIFKPLRWECEWKPDLDRARRCFVNRLYNKICLSRCDSVCRIFMARLMARRSQSRLSCCQDDYFIILRLIL